MNHSRTEVAAAVEVIRGVRAGAIGVHCLTNSVAQNFTANVLLACGAIPSMTVSPDEVPSFVRNAGAVLVNLGTLDADRRAAMPLAIEAARERGVPVVLDPVMCHLSPLRLAFARGLIAGGPLILKANAAESGSIGPVATACRVVTGPVDRVESAEWTGGVANGHALMHSVIAMGCALGALIAACSAVAATPHAGPLAGLLWFGVAGEIAAESAAGPGSFATAFLDTLASVDEAGIAGRARLVP